MRLLWVWKGKGQRWIAQGLLSHRSELIPFRDAQQEAGEGIFQQQHSHCWDAKTQHGWRATLLSNFRQIAGISSGVMFASLTGKAAALIPETWGRWRGQTTALEEMLLGRFGLGGMFKGTFILLSPICFWGFT